MKNLFQKLSSATTSLKQQVVSKSAQLMTNIKNKVAMLSTAAVVGISQPAIAAEWHKVDTPGIGPRAFAEKNFGTSEWKDNLVCRQVGKDGEKSAEKLVTNPKTDVPYRGECTIKQPIPAISTQETSHKLEEVVIQKKKTKKTIREIGPTNVSFDDIMQLDGFKNFDSDAYFRAIGHHESKNRRNARNDRKGKELGVKPGKFAFGGYQFTIDTLKQYGVDLTINGNIVEDRVQAFLNNRELQDSLMEQYTRTSLEQIRKNPKIVELIQSGKTSLPAMLAKGHIAGHGSINMNWGGKDWLGTSVKKYAKNVEARYMELAQKSAQSEEKIVPEIKKDSVTINPELITPQISTTISSTPAANDEKFETPATVETVSHKTSSVVQNIQDRPQSSRVRNDQYIMLAAKRDQLIQKATKLELQATKLEKDVQSIVGESWGKRKFLIDIRNYREEAQRLRKHAHTINVAITPIDTSKKVA